ncbi:PE family protein, partial [Mycobacterium helveticum]|uniref:PE family protein n=1 Tax=Mycobacterium helveticum TaxID=2592811 RepID=UPI001192E302
MSLVTVAPEALAAAASDVATIGSVVNTAHAAASAATTTIAAAGADEVSTAISTVFSQYARDYQAAGAAAAAFHHRFVQALSSGAEAYEAAEAANANPLQALHTVERDVSGAINAPFLHFTGRPLFGNGANGTTVNGVGTAGGAGGWLFGNGGTGGTSTNPGATGGAGGAGGWLFGNGGT